MLLQMHTSSSYAVLSKASIVGSCISEAILNCLYCCCILILPDILAINKISKYTLSYTVLPLLLFTAYSYNPAASYALWYLSSKSIYDLPLLSITSSFTGAFLAGLICNRFFPDSPATWRRN